MRKGVSMAEEGGGGAEIKLNNKVLNGAKDKLYNVIFTQFVYIEAQIVFNYNPGNKIT